MKNNIEIEEAHALDLCIVEELKDPLNHKDVLRRIPPRSTRDFPIVTGAQSMRAAPSGTDLNKEHKVVRSLFQDLSVLCGVRSRQRDRGDLSQKQRTYRDLVIDRACLSRAVNRQDIHAHVHTREF